MDRTQTSIGGPESAFPATRWSLIRAAGGDQDRTARASLEFLSAAYWKPVYCYIRRRWRLQDADAKDLTQEFFATMSGSGFLKRLSPENGRFRSYVRAALDNFARLKHRDATRLKRGGDAKHVSLQGDESVEVQSSDPDREFTLDWARTLLQGGLQDLEAEYLKEGQKTAMEIFMLRDIAPPDEGAPSYSELAKRFGVKVTDVTNYLFRARKRLRELVLGRVRETVTSEKEAEREILELFGEDGP